MIELHPARWRSQRRLFVAIVLVGTVLRLGYGVARYQEELALTGQDFVLRWDYDALEHVLIAKSLIEHGAYRVPEAIEGKTIRFGPHDALFKAPLYQYFLEGVFAVSGYSFTLFFPLQALIGGIAAGLAALVAFEVFGWWRTAAVAGLAAAAHPLLVNSASQPYNENLFVALIFGAIWAFVRWTRTPRVSLAAAAGVMGSLAILCRESAAPLLIVMAVYALLVRTASRRQRVTAATLMLAVMVLMVAPWTARNFRRTGTIVPVSAISGTALAMGNNECLAEQPLLAWYWADGPCEPLNAKRAAIFAHIPAEQFLNRVVRNRVNAGLGAEFVTERPLDYLKLTAQRGWTTLVPFHPQQNDGTYQRFVLTGYWLAVIPAGLIGLFIHGRAGTGRLLAALIAAVLAPAILIYISADMRHRIPADLLFACFAGRVYTDVLQRGAQRYAQRQRRLGGLA
jgi:hypothetical protein